jgi:hypothetical protein
MFSFSDIERELFVPLLDVDMTKVFYKINLKNVINLIQLSTQFTAVFSSLLALTWNNCRLKTMLLHCVIFPHTLQGYIHRFWCSSIQQHMWGNSPHSTKIFKIQKRMVRIMVGYKNRVSCRSLFKKLEILPLMSQYILLLMLFVIKNF